MSKDKASSWILGTLAVLASIGAVGWLALSATRMVREVSQQQTCAQNLKVMGEACQMYQSDWHDVLVPYGAPFQWPPEGKFWPELLDPYLRKIQGNAAPPGRVGRLFKCPTHAENETCFCYRRSYGMNERCGGWLPGKRPVVVPLKSVKHPTATIRIAEVLWEGQGGSFYAARPSEFIPNDRDCHMFATWHMGRGNVLWIDGHVSSMTQEHYNMRDKGPYDGNIWLRLEGPKPLVP